MKRTGLGFIVDERARQKDLWGLEHDLEHEHGELVAGALHFILPGSNSWPFDDGSPKMAGMSPIERYTKAAAMLAAEIDRLLAEERISGLRR